MKKKKKFERGISLSSCFFGQKNPKRLNKEMDKTTWQTQTSVLAF